MKKHLSEDEEYKCPACGLRFSDPAKANKHWVDYCQRAMLVVKKEKE